MERGDQK